MALLGAHVSIAGGMYKAIARGEELGCESIQIFSQPSRTWAMPELTPQEIVDFRAAVKATKTVKQIVAHNSYLLNLSTPDAAVRKQCVEYFVKAMERCEQLEIDCLITHPGSHLGAGEDVGIRSTSIAIDEVLSACKGFRTKLVLENTAGQGGCLGHTFEQLRDIVEGTKNPDAIWFCVDTQHSFAAGYDFRTKEGYDSTMAQFDKLLGLKKIRAFHLNDALKDFGTRVDRHQNIGKGFLGTEAFRPLVNDPRFKSIPMCIETDPGEKNEKHLADLKLLKSLRK